LRHVDVQKWNWKGIDVVNAHERDPRRYVTGMQNAIDAIKIGKIDPAQLYTDTVPLDRVSDAFEMTTNRPDGFMKALIVMK
jgi:threonine dehydrogenase-like Zn-dependent dehydrogenase